MTRLEEPPVELRSPAVRGFALFLAVAASLIIIAHGCHGDDIDHEPGIGFNSSTNNRDP